ETVVLAGGLIEDVASPEQRQSLLPDIMAGESIWALAWAEGRSRYDFNNVTTTARRQGDKFVLSGTKAAVVGAPWADNLIVSARTSGGPRDRDGVRLFVVDRHGANLSGVAAPHGRHVHRARRSDFAHPASEPQPRRPRAKWVETGVRREVEGRIRRTLCRGAGRAATRRHGYERRIERRSLLQANKLHQRSIR